MSLAGEAGILLAYVVGMFGLFVATCMFIVPIKMALKLLINSIIGGIAIVVINIIGSAFGLHISLNMLTAFIAGVLGVPGVVMIIFMQIVF